MKNFALAGDWPKQLSGRAVLFLLASLMYFIGIVTPDINHLVLLTSSTR